MFLQARGVIRRRWKAAEVKAKEAAELAVEEPAKAVDGVLALIATEEAAELQKVREHFAQLAAERARQIAAVKAAS